MSKKTKKQFRLYDVYRYYSIREMSCIEGIEWYEVTNNCSIISVRYEGSTFTRHYTARNEDELRSVIRTINKKLGNCYYRRRK